MTDAPKKNTGTWYGRPITELSRTELFEVIEYTSMEIARLQKLVPYVDFVRMAMDQKNIKRKDHE